MGLKLMCVVAHPDDECYAFGGALALAADRGIETYVVCLTDGQAATHRGDAASGEALGKDAARGVSCFVQGAGGDAARADGLSGWAAWSSLISH